MDSWGSQKDAEFMNEQERQVIDDIFKRLEQVANQSRDPEAERYIAEKVRQQPYAPYVMAQSILVQEQALANLNAEVERLKAEAERSRSQGGSFLSGLFGGGPRAPERPQPAYGQSSYAQPGSPWGGGAPTQQMGASGPWGARGGGGFLQSAMATAAGVAGGMMIANALSSAFGGSNPAQDIASAAGLESGAADQDISQFGDPLHQANADDSGDFGMDSFDDGGDGGDWT
jgi:hypothetical protein